jgi:uncharacterized protein YbjT (DUF2867 family)
MNITILGASGKTGIELVRQALAAGHQVTALVRTPEAFPVTNPALSVVVGDARVQPDLAKALVGQEAVLSALGSMKAGDELLQRSTAALVRAAQDTGVQRIVQLSSFLAAPNYKPGLAGKLMSPMVSGMVADKRAGEELLTRSSLDWTIVYATGLDKANAGQQVRIVGPGEQVTSRNGIARADVARFLLNELDRTPHHRGTVVITAK